MIDLTRKWYFSPLDDTKDAYLTFLQTATKSIRIADYSFNIPEFETILPALQKKGVDVQLVLDKSQSGGSTEKPVVEALRASDIPMMIGTSDKHKIMHNKYTILDDTWIQYGSWNYTTAASDEDNFFCIENNPSLAEVFLTDWEGMYNWIKANEAQVN
jgi:phosphatidylserine/phosphatidylglycerophosphate/cardiolipin synthase-like enzyme